MRSRMDRYKDIDNTNNQEFRRSDKNRELYQNVGTNTKYTNFTDVSRANAVSLDDAKRNYRTREGYKTIKEYGDVVKQPKIKKELDEFNYLYQDHENRVYDINSVIEKAKANRSERDELEAKRKLKNTNYNILASLNPNELEKYRKEKVERNKPDEHELKGLIDTITSKTLAGEISKETGIDLLSDLMATSAIDKITPEESLDLSNEIIDKESLKKIENAKEKEVTNNNELKDLDKSFYTKSMDLSDKDFDFDDEDEHEKKVPTIIKVILIIILLALVGFGIYFVLQNI